MDAKDKKHHKKSKKSSKDDSEKSDSEDSASESDDYEKDYMREKRYYNRGRGDKYAYRKRDSHDRAIQRAIDALDVDGNRVNHHNYYNKNWREDEFYDFGHRDHKKENGEKGEKDQSKDKESALTSKIDSAVKKEVGDSL